MKRPRRAYDDTPEPIDPAREALRGLDDATVARMARENPKDQAVWAEHFGRVQFELMWSGVWSSGPVSEVPPPVARKLRHFL